MQFRAVKDRVLAITRRHFAFVFVAALAVLGLGGALFLTGHKAAGLPVFGLGLLVFLIAADAADARGGPLKRDDATSVQDFRPPDFGGGP